MDQGNLARILASAGETKTLEQLMEHPHAKLAKLSRHHILALRLYTTSSFCKINDPLRKDPPRTDMGAAAGRHRHFCDRGKACAKQLSAPTPVNCTTVQNGAADNWRLDTKAMRWRRLPSLPPAETSSSCHLRLVAIRK